MKTLLKVLVLISAFSVEIRVHAESLIVLPGCELSDVGHLMGCYAMNATEQVVSKRYENFDIALEPLAVFSAEQTSSEVKIKWLKGEGAVKSEGPVSIKTGFGTAQCDQRCLGAFKKNVDHFSFSALRGQWNLFGFGMKGRFPLNEGGSVNLGLVNSNGRTEWSQPYSLTKKGFEKIANRYLNQMLTQSEIEEIEALWKKGVETYSKLYQDRAERSIASHLAEVARKERAKRRREAEDRALRELFRRKTLLD